MSALNLQGGEVCLGMPGSVPNLVLCALVPGTSELPNVHTLSNPLLYLMYRVNMIYSVELLWFKPSLAQFGLRTTMKLLIQAWYSPDV